jgi:hypothetical protein
VGTRYLEKPRVKYSDWPNQAYLSLNDQTVLDHLQGRHTIGIYPLLRDETCWFLAADFDKESWTEDVAAFVDTCRELGIPVAVERSRSGNSAHVWFFFSTPVRGQNGFTTLPDQPDQAAGGLPEPGILQKNRICASQQR